MFTLILAALLIGLWLAYKRLRTRVEILEARLNALEPVSVVAGAAGSAFREASMPARHADSVPLRATPPPAPAAPPPAVPAMEPAKTIAAVPAVPVARPVTLKPAPPVEHVTPPPDAIPAPSTQEPPAMPAGADGWEVVVGTSWLNKIGVLVFVIGVALLVGYSMTQLGSAGRVAIGFGISAAMLATGVVLERRDDYRNYAHGLVAGGWAAAYFTAYAMHALPAARIVTSPLVGAICLIAIAAGMIAHSLRFRSQTVTALAYVVAYVTLALTPLSQFSLVASVPLAISLLVVAQRLGWAGISGLGLVSTYGIFVLRGRLFAPGAADDASGWVSFLVLAAYWLSFEVADIAALRSGRNEKTAPLFALNAVAFLGSGIIQVPLGRPDVLSLFLASTASAYLATAIVRSAVIGRSSTETSAVRFTTTHGALAIAAALVAWTIDIRTSGSWETLALLVETQLLVAAGIAPGDSYIRRMGAVVAIAVTWHGLATGAGGLLTSYLRPGIPPATAALGLTALAWYANREWMRARGFAPDALERAYTWLASFLVVVVLALELKPVWLGLGGFVVAAVLLEAGLRRAQEYLSQAYVVGALATLAVAVRFTPSPGLLLVDVWSVLPAVIAITVGAAFRLARRAPAHDYPRELRLVAGAAASIAVGFLALLQWHVSPSDHVGAVWAITALSFVALGAHRNLALARWHGYFLAMIAARHALLQHSNDPLGPAWPAAVVAAAAYGSCAIGRRLSRSASPAAPHAAERNATIVVAIAATAVLASFEWRVFAPVHTGGLWTITGLILLVVGLRGPRAMLADIRWQGYVLLFAGSSLSLTRILEPGTADTAVLVWIALEVLMLYGASLLVRAAIRKADGNTDVEDACRIALSIAGTGLMAIAIVEEVPRPMITLSWGLSGLCLLLAGFPARERVFRLSGLALLFLCLIKLFFYDLGQLDPWPRIISFVVLGLVLLAVSWVYTKLRERVERYL